MNSDYGTFPECRHHLRQEVSDYVERIATARGCCVDLIVEDILTMEYARWERKQAQLNRREEARAERQERVDEALGVINAGGDEAQKIIDAYRLVEDSEDTW